MNALNVSNEKTPDLLTSRLTGIARKFFSCNPLYLASAGLLLYGINRLSSAPSVGAESAQITFNFAALFVYEVLLVWTAIVLAQRAIWYDSLLLVGLENLFVLIPFSLVSRAVQLNESLARNMCVVAVLFAVLKFWALKRYIPRLNLSPRLLAFGGLALAANVALSLGLRRIYDNPHALNSWLTFGWLGGLPALAVLANFLPRSAGAAESPEQRSWLPFGAVAIWMTVTACHLGGVGYVFSFTWNVSLLAPLVWVLAWTLLAQVGVFFSKVSPSVRRALLVGPFLVPFLAVEDSHIFFDLSVLNVVGFAYLRWHSKMKFLFVLSFFSLVMALAGLPQEWTPGTLAALNRLEWVCGFLALAALAGIVVLRDPRLTVVGGIICFVGASIMAVRVELPLHWSAQAALVFCIAHSLRWRDSEFTGAFVARLVFCLLWIADAALWSLDDPFEAFAGCSFFSAVLLSVYSLHGIFTKVWRTKLVLLSAAIVFFSAPGSRVVERLRHAEPGYIAIAGSFILFGFGTLAALTKKRWRNGHSP